MLNDRLALLFIFISLAARLIAAAVVEPGFDEAYYRLFSLHLSSGYFDHPPLVAFTAGFGYWLTGVWTPLTLRLGPVLWFTLALAGFYTLSAGLYNRKAARLALILPHATPYFFAGAGAFLLPDNALIAVWVWALVVARMLREGEIGPTLGFSLLGLLTGIALMAKYHAILLPVSLVFASIYDRELRRWWMNWRLYLALLIAAAVFWPCLQWNADNGWISLLEQFGKGASGGLRIRFDLLAQAIGGQLGYITPWLTVALWVGALNRRPGMKRNDGWLLAFFLVPVVSMTLIGLTRTILPHWAMPGYVAAIILASSAFAEGRRIFVLSATAVGVNMALIALIVLQTHTGLFPILDKSDPTLDPAGWSESIQFLEEESELSHNDVLFAHKWFTAAEIAWADKDRHRVVVLGRRPHMFAWWAPETEYENSSGVFITQGRYPIDVEKDLVNRFEIVRRVPLPSIKRGGREVSMHAWRVEMLVHPQPVPYGPTAK